MAFVHDDQPQEVYDSFNNYIFSTDRKLFGKVASKLEFCEKTKDVPGDILELGVFKGSGLMAWLKSLEATNVNHKNVIGFDLFDSDETIKLVKTSDKNTMMELFKERNFDPKMYENVLVEILWNARFTNFDLIKGDVIETIPKYLKDNPGFRASIVNFDLDLEEPTLACMEALWSRLVPGGYFILDEYALKEWTESNAVDVFCQKYGVNVRSTKYFAPSAYIYKDRP